MVDTLDSGSSERKLVEVQVLSRPPCYYRYMSTVSTQNYERVIWRTGRKVGRTIYAQVGAEPSDDDPLIGVFDTRELATIAVETHNEIIAKSKL